MNRTATQAVGLRPRIEIGLLAAFFAAVFAPYMVSMVGAWNSRPDASHGWFVLPISLWIAWRKRQAFLDAPQRTFTPALLIVVAGLLAAVISTRAALESVGRIALVVTLNGLLLYLVGTARYRQIAFPALFLFLMIPVPITVTGAVTFPLQILASQLSEHAIALIGIPVVRMGNVLNLPGGKLEVAEACSGLRSLMSFVALGALLAWVATRPWKKVVIVLLSLPVALLANVTRITLTAAAVQIFGPAGAEGMTHEVIGVVSFMLGLALYAAAARALGSKWAVS